MFPYACYGGNGIRGYVDIYNKEGQFPIIGRQGALCGNVNFATGKFYATEHAVVVTCFAGVNVDWARLVLEAMNLNQYATATAQPGLSVATVVEVNLLLPPLEEQKRIADFVLQYLNIIECMGAEANDLMQGLKNAKSKILDLAIHGKLVTQDPTDEPASELLKRINPKADISCDNPQYQNSHFEIPDSWRWCIINDLFEITMGQSPEGETYNNTYGIEFHQGKINFTEKYLDKSGVFTTKPTKIAKAGSILMCVRAPVGIINITQREVCIGRGLCALKCKDIIDPDYAFYALQTIQSELESKATGSTFKAISCSIIRDEPLPLPPYEEQKRIVLKIQELNECICSILNQIEA